jgi:3-hexulose-6-phosphate synthase
MKLQISFDNIELEKAILTCKLVKDYANIIEIGTSLILRYGIISIQKFRDKFPDITILADTKIIDRGTTITEMMINEGADWVTVMGGTTTHVIHTTAAAAERHKKYVMLDLLDSQSPGQSAMEANKLGIDAVLIHRHINDDDLIFTDRWEMVRGNTDLPVFISTDTDKESIKKVISLNPDGIVIGKAITGAANPGQEAEFFATLCK